MQDLAIRLSDVTLGYDRHPAVHHVEGRFEAGQLHAVVGPNGSGKSTLLKALAGTLSPLSGQIHHLGFVRHDVAYLPQENGINRQFPCTLGELVSLGFLRERGLFGGLRPEDRARLDAAFASVGLSGFQNRPLDTVSGGQLQRALFARVLLQDAKVVLLDEPFSAVDQKTASDLLKILMGWAKTGRLVVMVLHDLDMVRAEFDQALLLAREPVAWGVPSEILSPTNLQVARALCEAFDEGAHTCHRQGRAAAKGLGPGPAFGSKPFDQQGGLS